MRLKLRQLVAPLVVAGATAVTIAVAPVAQAANNPPECRDKGGASLCQRQGHSSIHVSPPPRGNQFQFGFGQMSPMWLLG